jgi:hypothetical protein
MTKQVCTICKLVLPIEMLNKIDEVYICTDCYCKEKLI